MSKKQSNKKFLIGLAVAFLLPLSLYLLVSKLTKGKIKMPGHFVIEKVDTLRTDGKIELDTVYHKISDLQLTNQVGERVSLDKSLTGKMIVVNLFFTSCTSSCPKLTRSMGILQKGFRKDPKKETSLENDVQFVSITVMPERDSVPAIRAYADKYGANSDHWWLLTGDKKKIYDFARNDLGLTTGPGDGGAEDFIHSDKLVLIDKDRFVRGYYNGLNDTDVRKCADDIVLLSIERKHVKKTSKQ